MEESALAAVPRWALSDGSRQPLSLSQAHALHLLIAAVHERKSGALELEVTSGQCWDVEPSLLYPCFRDPASVSSQASVAWSLVACPPHPTG